jgi:hypothetical protein
MKIGSKMSAWIFPIHLYALLIPLILIPMINQNQSFLSERIHDQKSLFYAVMFLMAGSFFEICQNHLDEWYVTEDSASGNGHSLLDGLFSFSILIGQCVILYGLIGNISLVKYLSFILILAMPIMYHKKIIPFLPLTIVGIANTICVYYLFGQGIIFLQFITTGLTIIFFNTLIKTENQFYHGLTTLFASSGIIFLYLAIELSSNG